MSALVHFRRLFHADLLYHVLGALDLRGDAASVFTGRKAPWAKGLLEAYCLAPGRLVVQGLPLFAQDLPAMLAYLREDRLPVLSDPLGRVLATRLADALEADAEERRAEWDGDAEAAAQRLRSLGPWLADLEGAYAALWSRDAQAEPEPGSEPAPPPMLEVHDCPSLSTDLGSHGRAMLWKGRLRVAVGLGGPVEQVLCQILHEATHSVTDPPVRALHAVQFHDTRVGSADFALHRELEGAAVAQGQRLIEGHAPRLCGAYRSWRKRHGC